MPILLHCLFRSLFPSHSCFLPLFLFLLFLVPSLILILFSRFLSHYLFSLSLSSFILHSPSPHPSPFLFLLSIMNRQNKIRNGHGSNGESNTLLGCSYGALVLFSNYSYRVVQMKNYSVLAYCMIYVSKVMFQRLFQPNGRRSHNYTNRGMLTGKRF